MKYGWRSGNTTYFEDRRFEGTVIFDGRIKPHFVKTLKKIGLMQLLKITMFQIGDLQNMLYFPSAKHISPMATFTLAD